MAPLLSARQQQHPSSSPLGGRSQVDGPRLQRGSHRHSLVKAYLDRLSFGLEPWWSRRDRGLQVKDKQAIKECCARINPGDLWKPDISLYNKQDLDHGILAADPRSANTNAHVHSNGNILWILPVSHKVKKTGGIRSWEKLQVLCEGVTYSNWPWGKQTCNLKFGSWAHDSHSYDLQFYDDQAKTLKTKKAWPSERLKPKTLRTAASHKMQKCRMKFLSGWDGPAPIRGIQPVQDPSTDCNKGV